MVGIWFDTRVWQWTICQMDSRGGFVPESSEKVGYDGKLVAKVTVLGCLAARKADFVPKYCAEFMRDGIDPWQMIFCPKHHVRKNTQSTPWRGDDKGRACTVYGHEPHFHPKGKLKIATLS